MKKILLSFAFLVLTLSSLTACHTIRGTVVGAGQDVRAVTRTVYTRPAPYSYPKKYTRTTTTTTVKQTDDSNDAVETY